MQTGRTAVSDAEKRLRGTLDPRWTEKARAERLEAKVVALRGGETVDQIPPPPEGLVKEAADEHLAWCRRLMEQGRLTTSWIRRVEMFAMRRHTCLVRLREGKSPRSDDMKACEMFLKEIGAIQVDIPQAGGVDKEAVRSSRIRSLSRMANTAQRA